MYQRDSQREQRAGPPEIPPPWPSDLGKLFTLLLPLVPDQVTASPCPGPCPRDFRWESGAPSLGVGLRPCPPWCQRARHEALAQPLKALPASWVSLCMRLPILCLSPSHLCLGPLPIGAPFSSSLPVPSSRGLTSCPSFPTTHVSVRFPSFPLLLWGGPLLPQPPYFCSAPLRKLGSPGRCHFPEVTMAFGGCKGGRVGAVISLPVALACWPLAWGWRKFALNGVSVETGKANTSA